VKSDRVCVDASVAISWLFEEPNSSKADAIRKIWYQADIEMVAPALFHAEVTSAIRRRVYFKHITEQEGEEAFSIFSLIPVTIIDGVEIIKAAWRLSSQINMPVCYDMFYLSVSESIQCEFWTNDRKFVNFIKNRNMLVKYLGDFNITKG